MNWKLISAQIYLWMDISGMNCELRVAGYGIQGAGYMMLDAG